MQLKCNTICLIVEEDTCKDGMPPEWMPNANYQPGVSCQMITCQALAADGSCFREFSKYPLSRCVNVEDGLVRDFCKRACDNCGKTHSIIIVSINIIVILSAALIDVLDIQIQVLFSVFNSTIKPDVKTTTELFTTINDIPTSFEATTRHYGIEIIENHQFTPNQKISKNSLKIK